jgi:metal-responsive CopG/Arc/MetJ family transcriptional regulator
MNTRFNIYLSKELARDLDSVAARRARVTKTRPNRSRTIGELILEAKRELDQKKAA